MVESAPLYIEAVAKFDAWVDMCVLNHGEIEHWLSWGDYDRKQFIAHAKILNAQLPKICELPHRNLKSDYSKATGKGKEVGVRKALTIEGMTFTGTPHRGLDDALNIARLAPVALGFIPSARKP
jgi:inhibitor of KinA sporulation pathway (predicted exonuclease)